MRALTFRRCGVAGFVAAVGIALILARGRGLEAGAELLAIGAAVATFLTLAMVTKVLIGAERLVYYHHEIAVTLAVAGVLALAGAPVLAHLDATLMGLAAFLAFGRVGCLVAGCCHGRPAARGVRYSAHHGVPEYLQGVPLFPVQAVESAFALCLLATGAAVMSSDASDGAATVIYLDGYCAGRFILEALRGDSARPVWRGVSEAQWTSVAVAAALAVLSAAGALPGGIASLATAVLLVAAAVALATRRRRRALADPVHVRELARVLRGPLGLAVQRTSAGIRITGGEVDGRPHLALSGSDGPLDPADAAQLASIVVSLAGPGRRAELVSGVGAVWHVLLDAPPTGARTERAAPSPTL